MQNMGHTCARTWDTPARTENLQCPNRPFKVLGTVHIRATATARRTTQPVCRRFRRLLAPTGHRLSPQEAAASLHLTSAGGEIMDHVVRHDFAEATGCSAPSSQLHDLVELCKILVEDIPSKNIRFMPIGLVNR